MPERHRARKDARPAGADPRRSLPRTPLLRSAVACATTHRDTVCGPSVLPGHGELEARAEWFAELPTGSDAVVPLGRSACVGPNHAAPVLAVAVGFSWRF